MQAFSRWRVKSHQQEELPLPEAKEVEEITDEVIEPIEEEVDENLDPPRGMGLKFDEIEKMIDEVLASEKKFMNYEKTSSCIPFTFSLKSEILNIFD